ncbi:hypothetical protein U4U31_23525, partial [Escherichia coli]|nr:hypothetical protein [Escherichia coli]
DVWQVSVSYAVNKHNIRYSTPDLRLRKKLCIEMEEYKGFVVDFMYYVTKLCILLINNQAMLKVRIFMKGDHSILTDLLHGNTH